MRIYLDITNKRKEFKISDYITFNITTCYSPSNLWVLRDLEKDAKNWIIAHEFSYKKVLSVMETIAIIDNKEFHGQVISIAEKGGIRNLVLNLGEENEYDWKQFENDYMGYNNVYFIDIDELKTNKEYRDLSIEECFAMLFEDNIDYNIRTLKYILPNKQILNASEYSDLTGG